MKTNKQGFTLLELLIVVLIIGVLAGIALPKYQMAVMKSRYSTMMNIVNAINDAEERYYLVHDEYAATFNGLDIDLSGCSLSNSKRKCNYDWGYCEINLDSGASRVFCYDNTKLNNAYAQYLKQGKYSHYGRACLALTIDKNDKYNKLCKNMGTRNGEPNYCNGIGSCVVYKF